MDASPITGTLPKGTTLVAMILVLGALPPMLDSTIVNVAVNGLARTFGTDLAVMQWAVTGYVLAMGVAVPFSGHLMAKFDAKRVYMGALVLFLVGSALSGLAWNATSLIGFRFLQGFSGGILMPLLSTMAVRLAGEGNLGKLMSLVAIPAVFAPIIGPVVGGLVMEYLRWQWLFFLNLPLGAIGLAALAWKLPRFEPTNPSATMDWPGVVLLAIVSSAFIYGVTQVVRAGERGVGVVSLLLGAAATGAYVIYAFQRKGRALISPDLFRSKNFSAAFVSLFLAGFATNGPMLILPMFFQNVRGLSVIMAALWLIPQGVGMLITRPMIGKLVDRIGARFIVLPSIAITLLGTAPFVFFTVDTSSWWVWLVLIVRGAGVGGFTVPLMADCFTGLTKQQVPVASVATRIVQNVGAAFGSAVLATVVTTVLASAPSDLVGAYHAGFLASLVFMLIGVAPAFFLTNRLTRENARPRAYEIRVRTGGAPTG
ncbi:MAG: multidrug efflux MFS transporter [Propionibacteriaceae bacterium]|nr:multidrug efflux MFS transporter [Propionibacteriaceae bacterium]